MREVPLPAYRYLVTLHPGDAYLPRAQLELLPEVADGAFSEVKGLGADLEVTAYPEGGVNDFVHQLPVRHSWQKITLQRGVVREKGLWEWYRAGLRDSLGARRDGTIVLLTHDARRAVSWRFFGGIAVKWTGPDLSALQNNAALESLEIAHHGIEQVFESQPEKDELQ